jgi:uncharacterized membrane protein
MNRSNTTNRIASVDILRGIIMVIMALDHVRDFFSNFRKYDPLDLDHTSVMMFFTRWITHFCAPVFVFLAGTSVFLSLSRGKTIQHASRTLFTRGLWLVLVEVTIVRLGWTFNFDYSLIILQVIWAIGISMIFLSLLIHLPKPIIAAIGLIIVFGHNYLDSIHASSFNNNAIYWNILHEQGAVHITKKVVLFVIYPVVPWIGVMALGYCFGSILKKEAKERDKWLYFIGSSCIALFIIIRFINQYGDPFPWKHRNDWTSVLAFIKCQKYPPSLLYLLMTLGPSIAILPVLEKMKGTIANFFTVYGRVPMFYYALHIYLIHSLAIITGLILGVQAKVFTSNGALFDPNLPWGFSLPIVYLYWIATVLLLYYPCRWFMNYKMEHKKWWLSYL